MNYICFDGYLVDKPIKIKIKKDGQEFTLAEGIVAAENVYNKKEPSFIKFIIKDPKTAKHVARYANKGDLVWISGTFKLTTKKQENQKLNYYFEVTAETYHHIPSNNQRQSNDEPIRQESIDYFNEMEAEFAKDKEQAQNNDEPIRQESIDYFNEMEAEFAKDKENKE